MGRDVESLVKMTKQRKLQHARPLGILILLAADKYHRDKMNSRLGLGFFFFCVQWLCKVCVIRGGGKEEKLYKQKMCHSGVNNDDAIHMLMMHSSANDAIQVLMMMMPFKC